MQGPTRDMEVGRCCPSEETVKQLEKGLPRWSLDSEKWDWMEDVSESIFLVYMRKLFFSLLVTNH